MINLNNLMMKQTKNSEDKFELLSMIFKNASAEYKKI